MQRVLGGQNIDGQVIAEAVEVQVSNSLNPTELNALGDSGQQWAMTYEPYGGFEEQATLYRLQPYSAGPEVMPYIVGSNDPAYFWIAVAGRYQANSLGINQSVISRSYILADLQVESSLTVGARNPGAATIQLDHNSATGFFTGSLSPPAALTANRRWTFPDADLTISGSSGALTSDRIVITTAGGVLTTSANLTFTTTTLNIANTTAASSSTVGALTIGNGTAATNVAIGGGIVYVGATSGNSIVLGSSGFSSSALATPLGNLIRHREYGYLGYTAVQIGNTSRGTGFGIDPNTITGGQFTGNSTDVFFSRNAKFLCPNAGATDWETAIRVSGGGATVSTPTVDVMGSGARVTPTTAASSSITGALVVGDGATAATNVGIGGGNINAGGTLTVAGSSSLFTVNSSGSFAGDFLYKISNSSGTGKGLRVQPGADGQEAFASRNAAGSLITWYVTGGGDQVGAGSILTTSNTTGIGYAGGAGGTVTQITSKATTVTLNKMSGQVTMNNAALAAGAKVTFSINNTGLATTDGAVVWVVSGGTANAYRAALTSVGSGTLAVTVENITAGSLSEAPVIGFAIIKAVNA